MPREVHSNRRTRLIVIAGQHFSRDRAAKCHGGIVDIDGVEVCTDTECMSSLESEAGLFRKWYIWPTIASWHLHWKLQLIAISCARVACNVLWRWPIEEWRQTSGSGTPIEACHDRRSEAFVHIILNNVSCTGLELRQQPKHNYLIKKNTVDMQSLIRRVHCPQQVY